MGRSDDLLFPEYAKILGGIPRPDSIAFLGSKEDNRFTSTLSAKTRDFYDLQLGNWDINEDWHLPQKYDLIVCTRCAYFSKDPYKFVEKCKSHLTSTGHALIDWGLGDHWRFPNYKVGWLRQGEHEFAYSSDNYLYSCYWNGLLKSHDQVQKFWNCVKNKTEYGYKDEDTIDSVVLSEVPSIVNYNTERISIRCLWPEENPQLYIITLL